MKDKELRDRIKRECFGFDDDELSTEIAYRDVINVVDKISSLIAQERRKAKIEVIEEVSNRLDDLHQGTEGAGWVHYGEMGEWLDNRIAELKEDKEA